MILVPPHPVVPGMAHPKRAEQGEGHRLEEPDARSGHVVGEELGGPVHPSQRESQISNLGDPPWNGWHQCLCSHGDGMLDGDADNLEKKKGWCSPDLGLRDGGDAATHVEEARPGECHYGGD